MNMDRLLVACNHCVVIHPLIGLSYSWHEKAILALGPSYKSENYQDGGFDDMWRAFMGCEDMFKELNNVQCPKGMGLWVYEQPAFDPDNIDDDEDFTHLTNGTWRRPTDAEALATAKGESPWPDGRVV